MLRAVELYVQASAGFPFELPFPLALCVSRKMRAQSELGFECCSPTDTRRVVWVIGERGLTQRSLHRAAKASWLR